MNQDLWGELYQDWLKKRENFMVKLNPFEEYPEENLWKAWEELCVVPPMRVAMVNVDLPYDMAQLAQVVLATCKRVPHLVVYLVGETLDFMQPKIRNKIMSWNIQEGHVKWIPRKRTTLQDLKDEGFRLIGTSPNQGENALDFEWGPRDVIVIGGAKGLSKRNLDILDEVVKVPCAQEVPFLTTPTVIPLLVYPALKERGLWRS